MHQNVDEDGPTKEAGSREHEEREAAQQGNEPMMVNTFMFNRSKWFAIVGIFITDYNGRLQNASGNKAMQEYDTRNQGLYRDDQNYGVGQSTATKN